MPDYETIKELLGMTAVAAPALLVALLGVTSLLSWRLSEEASNRATQLAVVTGLLASVAILALMLWDGSRHVTVGLGNWVDVHGPAVPEPGPGAGAAGYHFHFSIKFVFDRLSVPFAILSFVLIGTIGAFASKYMHREPGYNRFFVLYALFLLGMVVAALADTIETLFAGWELVGLSSALLVAFFQERPAPARNGLWVWVVYRVSDAALLLAAVVLHDLAGQGDFDRLLGGRPWPFGHASLTEWQALVVGGLLLVAAAGKSALVPFSGWLPRAMEGPTPSSAVFYGALSVHLGAFLLLRASPILECSGALAGLVVLLGLATAVHAYLSGSVQTDIKSALCYASLSQVGLIVTEVGLAALLSYLALFAAPDAAKLLDDLGSGLRYVALVHLLGHACLRTLQFVRAPSLLQDYRNLENALGARLPRVATPAERLADHHARVALYRFALERGYLDARLGAWVVGPFVRLFRGCDALERRWTDFLSGEASRESDEVKPYSGVIEELT